MNGRWRIWGALRRVTRWVACLLIPLVVLSTVAAWPASAADSGRRFGSLDDAAAAGAVSPDLVRQLVAGQTVEAMVSFDSTDAIAQAMGPAAPGLEAGEAESHAIDALSSAFQKMKSGALSAGGVDVVRRYEYLPTAMVRIHSEGALLALINSPDVLGVSVPHTETLSLKESLPLIKADQAAAAGNKGAGTYVAVLDTGVDYNRSPEATAAFGNCTAPNTPSTCKVFKELEIAPDDGILDDNGHGTNVAGIVVGVAPSTKIFAYDIAGANDEINDGDAVAALNDVIVRKKQGYAIDAVNLSFGVHNTYNTSDCTSDPDGAVNPYTADFAALRALNILPVVAAGNDVLDEFGSFHDGISYPACTPGAVSVGAVFDSDVTKTDPDCASYYSWWLSTAADEVTGFSQGGPNMTLFAPGACILAAGIDESGTSQATPHVAGAVAVLAGARPSASVDQIQTALANTGPPVSDSFGHPHHRLNVQAALAALPAADTTPPVVTNPAQTVAPAWTLGSTVVPVTVGWSATDASGIAAYSVMYSANGGAWTRVSLSSATATSATLNLTPASRYQFIVAAQDGAGNWGNWSYGPAFTVDAFQENSASIAYSGKWARYAWTSAYGGYENTSGTAGSTAKLTFTGRGIAWVAPTATNRGQAYVYLDGVYQTTIDLYSTSTVAKKVVYAANWTTSAIHTIMVKVVGTSGRPTVDVDAFVALR